MKKLLLNIVACLFSAFLHGQSPASLVGKGNKEYTAGRFQQASSFYRLAISKDENHEWIQALFNLGDALYQQKKYDSAAQQFNSFISLSHDPVMKSNAFYNFGNCLLMKKDYLAGIKAFQNALKQNSGNEDARYNLCYAMAKAEKTSVVMKKEKPKSNEKEKPQKKNKKQPEPKSIPLTKEQLDQLLKALSQSEAETLDSLNQPRKPVKKGKGMKDW